MSERSGWDALIEAIEIFKKYGEGGHNPLNCSHDVLTVCDGISPDAVSEEDKRRLEVLGFHVGIYDCFESFRFGSC